VEAVEKHVGLRILDRQSPPAHRTRTLPQQPQLHCLGCHMAGDEVPIGRFFCAFLQQQLLEPWPELTALPKGQKPAACFTPPPTGRSAR
jgi:hypothetical protein